MYSGEAYTMDVNSFTSLKFLNAWIPPDVAHAPMVMSTFDWRLML